MGWDEHWCGEWEGGGCSAPLSAFTNPAESEGRQRAERALAQAVDAMTKTYFELDAVEAEKIVTAFDRGEAAGCNIRPFCRALIGIIRWQVQESRRDPAELAKRRRLRARLKGLRIPAPPASPVAAQGGNHGT